MFVSRYFYFENYMLAFRSVLRATQSKIALINLLSRLNLWKQSDLMYICDELL